MPRVLIVDDDRDMGTLLVARLRGDFDVVAKVSASEAFDLLAREDFDVVVTDINMPDMNGLQLCERVVANWTNLPVIVMTAFGSLETAVSAIRVGAYDFLTKPFEMEVLRLAIQRAISHRSLAQEVVRLTREVTSAQSFDNILGKSPAMKRVYDVLSRIVQSGASVLIAGESGTGKEMVARAIHRRSRRKDGAFVAVNCAAIPETLLESEFFGHVKGAFTDARSSSSGLFVAASGGTLFLDEIGEVPTSMQPKLLRALQQRVVRPVGGNNEVPFDVRIISATNRDLETLAVEGRFREDLFYRLNVIQVQMPPLRARGNDVLLLAEHFLAHYTKGAQRPVTGISSAAASKLLAYPWPGNVRELQNCMERAVTLCQGDQMVVEDLPERIQAHQHSAAIVASSDPAELVSMEEVERRYILRVLDAANGNKTVATQILGFDRKTLYRKLERFGLSKVAVEA